jgi:hypothetical protein
VSRFGRRAFRNPARLASETGERNVRSPKQANLDAALCGIKVDSRDSHFPIEFEFNDLNANLMAPLCAVVIIFVVPPELRAEHIPR